MSDLQTIEQAAERYRRSLDVLLDETAKLDAKLRKIKAQHAPVLRRLADQAAQDGEALEALIRDNPQLFEKPRTRTLHGIKLGWQQTKATLSIPDPAATIAAIKKVLPDRQSELIKTSETVQRGPLAKLGKALLERLGVTVTPAQDSVIVKPAESDAIKMASEMLASAETAVGDQDTETSDRKGAA